MTHPFKLSDISKLWHSKAKHPAQKHTDLKSANLTRKKDDWAMSPEDALRVPYSGHK
jgi:hypothetical protein